MEHEIKEIIKEALGETVIIPKQTKEAKKEFSASKFMICFASAVYLATWFIAAYSWVSNGSFPEELVRYTSILFGVAFGSYCCKSAYEYKADKDCEAAALRNGHNMFP